MKNEAKPYAGQPPKAPQLDPNFIEMQIRIDQVARRGHAVRIRHYSDA